MRMIRAIIGKQLKDTLKNKEVLVQFVMFPLLAIIMNTAIHIEGMPDNFFVCLFGVMYIGMAPLTSMASIIAEEKEKNTLRVLMLSNVTPLQYLAGIGGYIWCICMVGATVFCITGKYTGMQAIYFMGTMATGILVSILYGAAIGVGSKNQMAATSITVPVMMIFSFLPMLSMFNDTIKQIARLTYSQQINLLIHQLETGFIVTFENIAVVILNIIIAFITFSYAYKRSGMV